MILRNTGIPFLLSFALLCYADLRFLQIEGLCNPMLSKSIGTIFSNRIFSLMSLCHILIILEIFQTFPLLFDLLR